MPSYNDWGIATRLAPVNVGQVMPPEEMSAISDGQFIKISFSHNPLFGLIAKKMYKDAGLISPQERKEVKKNASNLASYVVGEMFSLVSPYAVMKVFDPYSREDPCLILPRSQRCISAIAVGRARMEGRLAGLASKPEKWVKAAVAVEDIDLSHDALVLVLMGMVSFDHTFAPTCVPSSEEIHGVMEHLGLSNDDDPFVKKLFEFVRLSGELASEKKRRFY